MAATQSHLMKTTRRGRPFVKASCTNRRFDTHDLMATLLVSLPFGPHKSFFKTYPNSFTTDEAAANLASLKFSQSNRTPDPKDASRIVTTTTTTTFSMSRDMAKGICQHFLDAHLIECASDLDSTTFKDRGVYMITPKGLHILERFMTKNGIAAPHLLRVFSEEPVTLKMLHLERRSNDDEIIITKPVVDVLWRRFAGREPNVSRLSDDDLVAQFRSRWFAKASVVPGEEVDRSMGVVLRKVPTEKKGVEEYHFSAMQGAEWILDYTTAVGLDEAAEVAAQFVRYGYLALVSDKGRVKEGNIVAVVRGNGAGSSGTVSSQAMQEAEYRATEKAVYKITPEGVTAARWGTDGTRGATAVTSKSGSTSEFNSPNAAGRTAAAHVAHSTDDSAAAALQRVESRSERAKADRDGKDGKDRDRDRDRERDRDGDREEVHAKDSHTARLRQVLEEPALRSLFREFLRANFCEENLSFWLEVQDLKKKFGTTSSAVALPGQTGKGRTAGHQAMEKHQQDLITLAFVIYNTYLLPSSPSAINIDHGLRTELIAYMNQVSQDNAVGTKGHSEPGVGSTVHASQLQNIIRLYERIQTYIFRLMATDSVPKASLRPSPFTVPHCLSPFAVTVSPLSPHRLRPTLSSRPSTPHLPSLLPADSESRSRSRLYASPEAGIEVKPQADTVQFCKTDRFLNLMRSVFDTQDMSVDADVLADLREQAAGLALGKDYAPEPPSPTKAYLTISQTANEKQILAAKQRDGAQR